MAKKKIESKLLFVADLDSNNIYLGVKTITEKSLEESHVEVPEECDLIPGKYYYDPEKKTFLPTDDFLLEQLQSKRMTPKSVLGKKAR